MTNSFPNLINPAAYKEFLSSGSGSQMITFGYPSGTFVPLPDGSTGGQIIRFRSGNVIDAIQIGTTIYGGDGGGWSAPYTLPQTGQFTVQELWAGDDNISNLTFIIGGNTVSVGNGHYKDVRLTLGNLAGQISVVLAGITYDTYVNQLTFKIAAYS